MLVAAAAAAVGCRYDARKTDCRRVKKGRTEASADEPDCQTVQLSDPVIGRGGRDVFETAGLLGICDMGSWILIVGCLARPPVTPRS